jgi:hypothetical protein
MNQERCLKAMQDKVTEAIRQKDIVATIPLKTIIEFSYDGHCRSENGWTKKIVKIAGIIKHFNLTSTTIHIIAVQDKDLYPFNREPEIFSLKYVFLKQWQVIPKKDLPLLMGWEFINPLLSKLI